MIIKEIRIKNFRSYYGDNNRFEFSKDGLTLILGDNGDGKTTLFEAIQWLLDTTVDRGRIEHVSEMRKSKLEIGEHDEVLAAQQPPEHVHAPCRALEAPRRRLDVLGRRIDLRQLEYRNVWQQGMQVFPPCFEALAAVDKHDRRPRRRFKRRGIDSMLLRPREAIDERPPVCFLKGLLNLLHCGILAECPEQSLHADKTPDDFYSRKKGLACTCRQPDFADSLYLKTRNGRTSSTHGRKNHASSTSTRIPQNAMP